MIIQTLLNLKVSLKTLTSRVRNLYSWLSTNPVLSGILNPENRGVDKTKKDNKRIELSDPATKKLMKHLAQWSLKT